MIESIRKNKTGITLILLSSITACVGQLFWKLSTIYNNIFYLLLGFLLYGIGAVLMIVSYRFGKVSVLQPLLSFNYIITPILGYFVLNEVIGTNKLIGILIIFIGVVFIAGGDDK